MDPSRLRNVEIAICSICFKLIAMNAFITLGWIAHSFMEQIQVFLSKCWSLKMRTVTCYHFQPQGSSSKRLLNQAILSSKQLKNQREIQCRTFEKDVAELLKNGQEASALSKVEYVFKEQNMIDVYVLIEEFCSVVIKKMVNIEKQKACPSNLREAISSLCFAAQRCAELPELQQIRHLFTSKYGREFTTTLPEVQPDCEISKEIIKKLSTSKPSRDMKLKLMKKIANQNGIGWKIEKFPDGSDGLLEAKKMGRSSRLPLQASSVLENINDGSELEKWPVHLKPLHPAPEISSSPPLSSISSLDDGRKEKIQILLSAKNGNGKLLETENYDSHIHFTLENRKKSTVRPIKSGELNSSEKESSARYSRAERFNVGYKEVKVMYTDVATAAQAALESAAHATMAARAALTLSNHEYNHNLSQTTNDSSEITSDSSDEDEAIEKTFLGDRNEQRHSKHSRGFKRSGVSKCSEQRRDTYDDNDYEYQSISNDVPDRKKAQVKQKRSDVCFNKSLFWAKLNSNNQSSPSIFNDEVEVLPIKSSRYPYTHQNVVHDIDSDKRVSLFDRRQYQNPRRVPNRSMSERRFRPRMTLVEEGKSQRSQSSRPDHVMQSDDFECIKFKFRSKSPMPKKSKQSEIYGKDDSYEGTTSKFIVYQNSDKEGLHRCEGRGKLRWYSANLQDKVGGGNFMSIDEIGSMNSYNDAGKDRGNRSHSNGEFSTELMMNQSIHGLQEKKSRSKNVVGSTDSGLEGNKEEGPRIDLARLPKSLRSRRMHFTSKADE